MNQEADNEQEKANTLESGNNLDLRFFVVGCFLLAAAFFFAYRLLDVKCPTVIHMVILKWILPLASGFAIWSFAGAITVRARGMIQGIVITATGGFGIWLISIFILIPKSGWDKNCTEEIKPVIELSRVSTLIVENCGKDNLRLLEVIEDDHKLLKGDINTIQVLAIEDDQGGSQKLLNLEYYNGDSWVEIKPYSKPETGKITTKIATVPLMKGHARVRYTWDQLVGNDKEFGLGIKKNYILSKIDAIVNFPCDINFDVEETKWIQSIEGAYCFIEINGHLLKMHCGGDENGKEMRLEKDTTYGVAWKWDPMVACGVISSRH